MDGDSWSARLSTSSKRYQSTLQSRSDMFMGFEEIHADDDIREEFPCPFCSEYYDIVGLCHYTDEEHLVEAKNRVCPVCSLRVGIDMVHTLPRSSRHHHLRRKENQSVHHHHHGPFDEARSHRRSGGAAGQPRTPSSSASPTPQFLAVFDETSTKLRFWENDLG